MLPLGLTVLSLLAVVAPSWQQPQLADPTTIASLYSLTTSTSIPFPTATLSNSDAQSFITSGWSLSKGRIQQGGGNIAFVNDPFPDRPAFTSTENITGPVLQVRYPAGAVGSEASGMQLYSLWNTSDSSSFQSMLISYEVAFDENFDFVKGGKLPGLRGGPDPNGCSGGNAANGSNCFSTRLMWRTSAAGEGASVIQFVIPRMSGMQRSRPLLSRSRQFDAYRLRLKTTIEVVTVVLMPIREGSRNNLLGRIWTFVPTPQRRFEVTTPGTKAPSAASTLSRYI